MPTKKKVASQDDKRAQVSFPLQQGSLAGDPGFANDSDTAPGRFDIGREHILSKYWELANLDPEATKGNIAGQLKALDSLCEELQLAKDAQENDQDSGRQEIYRSAWMRRSLRNTPTGNA
jgi:hypothetical protein